MIDPMDGERIDRMIAAGKAIVDEAIRDFEPAAVIGAFSGGNDSLVSTHFACEHYATKAVHCDTGVGVWQTKRHVRDVAGKFGWTLDVRVAPVGGGSDVDISTLPFPRWVDGETAYEENVLNNGFPGPAQHGRMFQRLKERQLREVARELAPEPGAKLLIISGIRHDESAIRAGYKRAVQEQEKTKLVWANPFYWHTAEDFEAYRQEFSLPRNPVKARIGISGECLCGSFASPGERERVRSVDPDVMAYLDGLEAKVRSLGFPWGWGERPPAEWTNWRRAVERERKDKAKGQSYMFDDDEPMTFRPMCVGCSMNPS